MAFSGVTQILRIGAPWERPPPNFFFLIFDPGRATRSRTATPMHAKCARSLYTDSGLVKMQTRDYAQLTLWVSMEIKWYHISAIY